LFVTLNTPQLSFVTGVPIFAMVAPHWPPSFGTLYAPGAVMVGFSISVTATVKSAELVLPDTSVAVTVTVVTPTGNTVPGALL
jgi:hypothetical protein